MPLQLDVNGDISTPTNDTGTYTWDDVVALNSFRMVTWVTGRIYQWTGKLVLQGTATLNIENKTIHIFNGVILTKNSATINFGNSLNSKNGCFLILDSNSTNNSNRFALSYERNNNNTRVNLYGCAVEVRYPGARNDVFVSKIIDSILKFTGTTAEPGSIYIQSGGTITDSIFKNIGSIELPGSNYTINNVQFYDCFSTFLNYENKNIIPVSNFKATTVSRDYLSNEGGFRFINSSINLSNGYTGYFSEYGGGTQASYRSFVAYEHHLKLLTNNVPVQNALIKYTGFSSATRVTDVNGAITPFLLDVEHNNYQIGNGSLSTVSVPSYTRTIKSYAHLLEEEILTVNSPIGTSVLPFSIALTLDSGITQSQSIAEAITGITHTTNTITVTNTLTLNQIYDSRKAYWRNNDNVNPPYLTGTTFNLNGANLIVDGVNLFTSSKFRSITTTGTITYVNNGNTAFPTKDNNGFRFKIYGLPTKTNSFPVIRVKRISNNTITNPITTNGEVYIYLIEGEDYEIRADARGFIASNFITINTNTSSELQITLEEILDANNNPVYGNGVTQEKDLITYDNNTNTIFIAYNASYPTISIFSAVDKLEEILATTTGLEIAQHPVYENGKLVFIRNILTNAQSTIKIKPASGNTGDPELLFELVREGDEKPYNLFDFSNSNGRVIKYPTTVNTANVNTSSIATSVWSSNTRTLTSVLTSDQEAKLNNLDVAVSTRLSSDSYVQSPTTTQIKTEIESSTILAKEATTASRASQTSVNLIPTNTLLTTDSRLNNLDTTISSRLATSNYLAPTLTQIENSTILAKESTLNTKASQSSINNIPTAIRTELTSELNKLDVNVSTRATQLSVNSIPINPLLTNDTRLSNLDIAVSTRLATSAYNSAPTVSDIRTELSTELSRIDATVSSRATSANVWTNTNRSLTEGVTVNTNNDKTNYELSNNSILNIWNTLITSLTTIGSIGKRIVDFLDTTISSRLSSSNYNNAPTVIDIRNELSTELSRIDATISSRSSQTSLNNKPNLTDIESSTVLAKQSTLLNIPTNTLLSTDSRLNTLDANISSRLANSNYVIPLTNTETIAAVTNALNTKDVVTNTNLNTALDNIEINGLNTDQNNKLTQISNDVIRLAKLRGLSGVSVIAKSPTNTEAGYLKTSDNDINLVITKVGDEEILSD